jgi:hypothetical protein
VYNKGQKLVDGEWQGRWYVKTKNYVKIKGVKNPKRLTSFDPEYKHADFKGEFPDRQAAEAYVDTFIRLVNGERIQPTRASKEIQGTPQQASSVDAENLSVVLKRKRATQQSARAMMNHDALHAELKKVSRANSKVVRDLTQELCGNLKVSTNMSSVAKAVVAYTRQEKAAVEGENKARAERRSKIKKKKKTKDFPSYQMKRRKSIMKKMKQWETARDKLAPFVKQGTTEGLVMTEDGIDLSSDGNDKVPRKATIVHAHCSIRLLGKSREEATEIVTTLYPSQNRMSSGRTMRRYLAEFFQHGGFFESKQGKWVRENVFNNTALKYAMKEWLRIKQYTVIQSTTDPEERKYLVAKHACDHLNNLLEQHPRFKLDAAYAAAYPVKVALMRVYLKTHLGMEWKANKKGTANATHDRDDAVTQRNGYTFANRERELQNLVWHHAALDDLKVQHPHLYDLARIAIAVDAETEELEKKLGDPSSNELLHNVHCYMQGGKQMVELHVDVLPVTERMRLYPFWGGGISKRVDHSKNLVEEHGQDEAAFHQNDERKNHWHEKGKVRLTQSEKQRGACSHCAVVTNYRHGTGGNLIPQEQWDAYNAVREELYGPYEPAFANPFMVWARVGGDHGHWGGAEVAMQFKEVQQFLKWEEEQPEYKEKLAALAYPGPTRIQACFGADRSQTHLLGKPDGIVMGKFNAGTKVRSKTNARSAEKFVIPRDVVLLPGDIKTNEQPATLPSVVVSSSGSESSEINVEICADNDDAGLEDLSQNIPDPPLGNSSISEEVARVFDDEVFCGTITEFEDDEEGGLYKVIFYDGDSEQLDADEYYVAWQHAYVLANPPKRKRPKKNKRYLPLSLSPPPSLLPAPLSL